MTDDIDNWLFDNDQAAIASKKMFDDAVAATIGMNQTHRCYPPGVVHHTSVDGPFNIAKLVPENSVMMELGSYYGESTMFFWRCGKFKKVIAVDPFLGTGDNVNHPGDPSSLLNNVVVPSSGVVEHWRMKSQDAIPLVEDKSLDLVYIDAIHDYENVSAEVRLLLPKMKPGAVISGHDYHPGTFPGVVRAVNETLGAPTFVYTDTSWAVKLP